MMHDIQTATIFIIDSKLLKKGKYKAELDYKFKMFKVIHNDKTYWIGFNFHGVIQ